MIEYEDLHTISVYDLMKSGALIADTELELKITFGDSGDELNQASLFINTKPGQPCINISYTTGGTVRNCRINLVCKPFNLNKGSKWYFICPFSGRPCMKLYYYDGHFRHRKTIDGIYRNQALSHNTRNRVGQFNNIKSLGKMLQKATAPYFRPNYAGAPTRPYKKIMATIKDLG